MIKTLLILAAVFLSLFSIAPGAEQPKAGSCRLVIDAVTGEIIVKQGPCNVRVSPCSTFKIPLAAMGFDSGILKSEHDPLWAYLPEYHSSREEANRDTDPTSWELNSVVWYSQKLTRTMGLPTFQKYVNRFDYGNKDLGGNPGKDDGLTQAWLTSSLKISAEEQVKFLQKLLNGKLGVSNEAGEMTQAILPKFPAPNGWIVTGKTGSGLQKNTDGSDKENLHLGWFVGWATNGKRKIIFAKLIWDATPHESYGGKRAREEFLQALPGLMKEKN